MTDVDNSAISPFDWPGQDSIFLKDPYFTREANAINAQAKKAGAGLVDIPSLDDINTEAADRAERPRKLVRAL